MDVGYPLGLKLLETGLCDRCRYNPAINIGLPPLCVQPFLQSNPSKDFLRAEEHGLPLLKDNSHVHQLVRSSTNAIAPRVGGASDERRPSWLSTTQKTSIAALRRSRSRFRVRLKSAIRAAATRGPWMTGR